MTTAIILAAGAGKRMHSDLPKVIHPVLGRPMVLRVIDTATACGFGRTVVVVGHGRDRLIPLLDAHGLPWVVQDRQLGTAHAVSCAIPMVDSEECAVLLGDVPLLRPATVSALLGARREGSAAIAVLTATAPDPSGYGRILRRDDGFVERIVEERDADPATREIREINTGLMAFDTAILRSLLSRIGNDNAQGEFYLTDAVTIAVSDGLRCAACVSPSWEEVAGINDPFQLAQASRVLARRRVCDLMAGGVGFFDPEGVWIEDDVLVGPGSLIGRFVRLSGATVVGPASRIGDGCILEDATVPAGTELQPYTVLKGSHG